MKQLLGGNSLALSSPGQEPLLFGERFRGWLLQRFFVPSGSRILRDGLWERYGFLRNAQWWPREEIGAYQREALKRLVKVAYEEVPLYRDLFRSRGLRPGDFEDVEDLKLMPVVTKELLSENYPDRVSRMTSQRTYEARTSGSTGAALSVLKDGETTARHRASFLLALNWAGWVLGERHLQTGMTFPRGFVKRLKDLLFGCAYFSAFDLRERQLDRALLMLDGKKIRHLWGYPMSIRAIAERASSKGWNQPLKSVVVWGDKLDSGSRTLIENAFQCRVFDTYGCGEGFQIAAQCGCSGLYHTHDFDVVVEFADESGEPVQFGSHGELLVTRLHPGPMPFIRYRVGDLGIEGDQNQCPCGRELRTMTEVLGRSPDRVVTPDGNHLIVHFFTGIFEHVREILQFQVVQDEQDHLLIKIVPAAGYSDDVERFVVKRLKAIGAESMRIDFKIVKKIPLTESGKRRFVRRTYDDELTDSIDDTNSPDLRPINDR
jgi:phenylacetate-CoA ligase